MAKEAMLEDAFLIRVSNKFNERELKGTKGYVTGRGALGTSIFDNSTMEGAK